ncbi:MAG: phosphodiester glycosidase family protein [Deltaproteobacteria bacterium]|nr:phosphodiester glycosidase family protein [Deltaproteobacteria bacterium]
MLKKNKTPIWAGLLALWLLAPPAPADEPADLSGRLNAALWRLAGFLPEEEGSHRSLSVPGPDGLPAVTISLTFDQALDPWPESLSLTSRTDEGSVTMTDRRPFGGPNLRLTGRDLGKKPAETLTLALENLWRRLMARPRLASFTWQAAAPGFDWAGTKILYGARFGANDLYLARFDPARYLLKPYHESEFPKPVNLSGWGERLPSAQALINAGQFYPDRRYMGRLRRDGREISPENHRHWRGFVVSGPRTEGQKPLSAIIDLENPESLAPDHYLSALQSFMLLDRGGRIRVRDTANLAARSVVAEDREGRLLLIMTPAAISLHDLALALQEPGLGLVQALGLDGGFESQFLWRRDGKTFQAWGPYSLNRHRSAHLPGYHPTLPAVLAVETRPGH